MSATYSDDELIKYAFDFDYAYSQYQMDSYVVNTGITDWRKAKQCLIEIEHRTQAMDDHGWNLKKMEAETEILREELAELTSPARQRIENRAKDTNRQTQLGTPTECTLSFWSFFPLLL